MNFMLTKAKDLNHSKTRLKIYLTKNYKKFGNCFEKAKSPESVTQVQIFDNYGKYYFKKVNGSFKGVLEQFDIKGRLLKNIKKLKSLRNDINFKKYLYYTRYILFRTVSSKNLMCNHDCELYQDLEECLENEEELRHYVHSTLLFRLCESL